MMSGLDWHPVTAPQRHEGALLNWKKFLEAKGVECRVVQEGKGFTLERFGKSYFNDDYKPAKGPKVGNVASERVR